MNIIIVRMFVAMLVVLALTILPLPEFVSAYRPLWVLLCVLYIQFFLPQYFRVSWLFLLGLSLDVLLASVMGEHTFALLFTTWLASTKARRFQFFSPVQQILFVALLCAVYALVLVVIDRLLGFHNNVLFAAGTLFSSVLCWPWLKLFADHVFMPVFQRNK